MRMPTHLYWGKPHHIRTMVKSVFWLAWYIIPYMAESGFKYKPTLHQTCDCVNHSMWLCHSSANHKSLTTMYEYNYIYYYSPNSCVDGRTVRSLCYCFYKYSLVYLLFILDCSWLTNFIHIRMYRWRAVKPALLDDQPTKASVIATDPLTALLSVGIGLAELCHWMHHH